MISIVAGLQILTVERGSVNNSILVQMGEVQSGLVEGDLTQYFQYPGFCSLPPAAQPGQTASEMLVVKGIDNTDICFSGRDLVSQSIYANMGYGETTMYAGGLYGLGQARVKCDQRGNIIIYTTDNNLLGGNGIKFQISPTALSFNAPWGSIIFDETSFRMNHISGATFDIGTGISLPPPFSALILPTQCTINAGQITLNGLTRLGQAGPTNTYLPAAMALTPVLPPQPMPPFTTTLSGNVFFATGV